MDQSGWLSKLGWAVGIVTDGQLPSAEREARRFRNHVALTHGEELCPDFVESSLAGALERAYREHMPFLVVLLSPVNDDSHAFCRDVLWDETVSRELREHFVVWGSWCLSSIGLAAQEVTQTTVFPSAVAYMPTGAHKMERVAALNELRPASEVSEWLARVHATVGPSLRVRAEEQLQREEDRLLREEQDRQYEEAMLAEQEEEARREAEEREKQREKEQEKKAIEEQAARIEDAKARLRQSPEPAVEEKPVATLRFRLPDSSRLVRRFRPADTIQHLFDFVMVVLHESGDEDNSSEFHLGCNFPRRRFQLEKDAHVTLEESGLCPQAVLLVMPIQRASKEQGAEDEET